MKYFLTTALLIGCLSAFAQNPINGDWKGVSADGTFEIAYTFKVEGNELKGVSKSQFGEAPVENGKVDGKKISYTITLNNMPIPCTGELVNDNEILAKSDWGEMKLTRVKK